MTSNVRDERVSAHAQEPERTQTGECRSVMADKAQIQEAIKVQGEVVRKLKAEKASKEQVCVYNL